MKRNELPDILSSIYTLVKEFKFRNVWCVYFLFDASNLVYVGVSANLGARISKHRENGKLFTHIYYVECFDERHARKMERQLIEFNSPKYNKLGRKSNGILTRYIDHELLKCPTRLAMRKLMQQFKSTTQLKDKTNA